MFFSIRPTWRKPLLVLIYSFFLGGLLDALTEQLMAQETFNEQRSSEFRVARLVKQDPGKPLTIQEVRQEPDGLPDLNIPGTLLESNQLFKPIMDIPVKVIDEAKPKPQDLTIGKRELAELANYPGTFPYRVAMWCAPNIRYQPLYFEDVALERNGYHYGNLLQPAASAAHFGGSLILFPFNMLREHPDDCTYPLGFCRPGTLSPRMRNYWLFWK
jgi:hypothetical protein